MTVKFDQDHIASFGPFRLFVTQRRLLESDRPVRLGSRALDILIALIGRPGELVSKRELMSVVWPDTVVVEANLTVHVAALRRALGDGQGTARYIVNIPGRGYRFVAPVTVRGELTSLAPQSAMIAPLHNLPARLTHLVGRAEIIDKVVQQLSLHRLLTIVGPGGVGKTAVALDAAEQLTSAYDDGVWLIDLAPIADPRLVPTVLASALRLAVRSDNPLPALIAALRDRRMLLVFDNCEHVVDAAAALAAGILRGSHSVRILATSREPLGVEGERSYRLSTLECPPASVQSSAAAALQFPAVQLFSERAGAVMDRFELSDEDAPIAGDICRMLDGIPLAIELAAARVDTLGVRGLAARLDDRLRLLTGGYRTALPRHRTISTALDWSYDLLSQAEQTVFRRIAIFAGSFSLESGRIVAADAADAPDIADSVANLVMNSLVTLDMADRETRYRLLETTRVYAMAKFSECGEVDELSRRHAAYFRDLLEAASNNSRGGDFAVAYAPEIDNIRAALNWAFAPGGDRPMAVALAAASAPIWFEMSLLTECRGLMEKALDALDDLDRGTRREMVLQTMLGLCLMYTQGSINRARSALTRASEIAENVQDLDFQLRALTGLAFFCVRDEDFRRALALARRAEAVAQGLIDPAATSTVDCIMGFSLFSLARISHTTLA